MESHCKQRKLTDHETGSLLQLIATQSFPIGCWSRGFRATFPFSFPSACYAETCELVAPRICMRAHWILWILLPSAALQFPSCTVRIVWNVARFQDANLQTILSQHSPPLLRKNILFLWIQKIRGCSRTIVEYSPRSFLLCNSRRNWVIAKKEKKRKGKKRMIEQTKSLRPYCLDSTFQIEFLDFLFL